MLSAVNMANMKYVTALLANKYVLTFVIFVVWMLFFDKNNLFTINSLQQTINHLEDEKAYYDHELTKLDEQMKAIKVDRERYARENFYLHRDNEIVFLIKE